MPACRPRSCGIPFVRRHGARAASAGVGRQCGEPRRQRPRRGRTARRSPSRTSDPGRSGRADFEAIRFPAARHLGTPGARSIPRRRPSGSSRRSDTSHACRPLARPAPGTPRDAVPRRARAGGRHGRCRRPGTTLSPTCTRSPMPARPPKWRFTRASLITTPRRPTSVGVSGRPATNDMPAASK